MTDVMHLARAYFATLTSESIDGNWTDAASFFVDAVRGMPILLQGLEYDRDAAVDCDVDRWVTRSKTLMRYQTDFLSTQGKVNQMISMMVNYFQAPRLQEPVLSFVDACLRLVWEKPYEQILHSASNNCYIRIPAKIAHAFDPEHERRQDLFIATCFWKTKGIPAKDIHEVDLSYNCLAVAGTRPTLPAVAAACNGSGENGR